MEKDKKKIRNFEAMKEKINGRIRDLEVKLDQSKMEVVTKKKEIIKVNSENSSHDEDMKLRHKNELIGRDLAMSKLKMDHTRVMSELKSKFDIATFKVTELEKQLKMVKK